MLVYPARPSLTLQDGLGWWTNLYMCTCSQTAMTTQSKIIRTISKEEEVTHYTITTWLNQFLQDTASVTSEIIQPRCTQWLSEPSLPQTWSPQMTDWPCTRTGFLPNKINCPTRSCSCPEHRHYPQRTAAHRERQHWRSFYLPRYKASMRWDSSAPSSPSHRQGLALTEKHSVRYSNQLCITSRPTFLREIQFIACVYAYTRLTALQDLHYSFWPDKWCSLGESEKVVQHSRWLA